MSGVFTGLTLTSVLLCVRKSNKLIGLLCICYQVEEPSSVPLQVDIKLSREGTSGEAVISWSLAGTGQQAASVTTDDVGAMQGTVVMQSGIAIL